MPSREPPRLFGTGNFRVLIGGRELGFASVGPLGSATDVVVESGALVHRFEPIILRRALSESTELYDWRRKIVSGKDDRRAVTIHQLDAAGGSIVNSWRLERAWPRRWSGPSFDAGESDVAMEEVELGYDDLVWIAEPEARASAPSRSRSKTEGA